ncbi:uncharacterized protein LOC107837238 [Poecilia formosa]|uniref:uncharacterized protein LOC107837238 n=1 Tax=Poecilia formosa TaxID=48698 RepID=UPI0007B96C6D|nr:PREDICTED: uncharacterized protein LOC107837238 [Poecilia formosa]
MMDTETSQSETSSCSNITRFDIFMENQQLSRIDFDNISAELNALLDRLRRAYESEESLDRRVHKMTASLETQRLAQKLTRKIYFHLSSDMAKTDEDLKKVSSSEKLYTVARKTTEKFFKRLFQRMLKSPDTFENQELDTAFKELQNEVSHISIPPETQSIASVTEDDQLKQSPTSLFKSSMEEQDATNAAEQHPSPVTCGVPDTFENQKVRTPLEELQDEVSNIFITPENQNLESTDIEEGQLKSSLPQQMKSLMENAVGQHPNPVTFNVADIFENQDVYAILKILQSEFSDTSISPETQSSESAVIDNDRIKSFPQKVANSLMENVAGQHPNQVICNAADTFENQDVCAVLKKLQSEFSDTSNSPDSHSSESTFIDDGQLNSFPQKLIKSFVENMSGQSPDPVTCSVSNTFENQGVCTAFKELQNEISNISIPTDTQSSESTDIDDGQLKSFPQKLIKSLMENVAVQHPNPVTYNVPDTLENHDECTALNKLQSEVSDTAISPETQSLESTVIHDGELKSFPQKVIKSLVKNVPGQHPNPVTCSLSSTFANHDVCTAFKKLQNHVSNMSIPLKTKRSESIDNDDGQLKSFPQKVIKSLVKKVAGQQFTPEPCTASVQVPSQPCAAFAQVPAPESSDFEHVSSAEKSTPFKFFKRPTIGTIHSKLSSIGRKHHPNIGDQGTSKQPPYNPATKRDLDSVQTGLLGVDPTARTKDRTGQDKQEKGIQCFEHGIAQGEDDLTDCEFYCKTCKSSVKPSVLKEFVTEVSDLLQCQTCKHEVYIISAVVNRLLEKYPRDSERLLLREQSAVLKRRLCIYLSAHLGIQKCYEIDQKLNSDYYAKVIVNNLLGIYGSPRNLIKAAVIPDSNFCDDFAAFVGCELVKTRAYKKYGFLKKMFSPFKKAFNWTYDQFAPATQVMLDLSCCGYAFPKDRDY